MRPRSVSLRLGITGRLRKASWRKGSGRTHPIAALAARYVAEGTPLQELLLVTFTRMATGELRDQVRERLVAVERGLETGVSDDEIVRLLADVRVPAVINGAGSVFGTAPLMCLGLN